MPQGTTRNFRPLFTWRSAIADSDLPPTTRHVALTISLHMNERGGSCFPTVAQLAAETGLSVSTVQQHRGDLERLGWLRLAERGGSGSKGRIGARASAYEATLPTTHREPDPGPTDHPPAAGGTTHQLTADHPPGDRTPVLHKDAIQDAMLPPAPSEPSPTPPKARARDPIFDALVFAWGPAEPKTRAAFYGRVGKELRDLGATPEQVIERSEEARRRFDNPTPQALVKHWPDLGGERSRRRREPTAREMQQGTWRP